MRRVYGRSERVGGNAAKDEVMTKKRAGRGFWAKTPEGHTVHINGRRDMAEETLDALLRMMDLAHKNATEVMLCGHTKANLVRGNGGAWFCGQCVLDEAEARE